MLICKQIKNQGEERLGCPYCDKAFKADHFVVKHVFTWHPEEIEGLRN